MFELFELCGAAFAGGALGLALGARRAGVQLMAMIAPLYAVAEAAQLMVDAEDAGDHSEAREWREELESALNHYRVERWWLEMQRQRQS